MCLKHSSLELFLQEMKYLVYKVLYMFSTYFSFHLPAAPYQSMGRDHFHQQFSYQFHPLRCGRLDIFITCLSLQHDKG